MSIRIPLVSGCVLFVASSACAGDAYNNFNADGTCNNLSSWVVGYWTPGFIFQSATTGELTGLTLAIGDDQAKGDQAFTVNVYADAGSQTSLGTLLGSWTATTDGVYCSSLALSDLVNVDTTGSGVILNAGQYYWLEAADGPTFSELGWDESSYATSGYTENGSWNGTGFQAAFSVHTGAVPVQTTPAPAAFSAFAIGLLGALRRRKKG